MSRRPRSAPGREVGCADRSPPSAAWPLLSLAVCAATASGAASGASQTSPEQWLEAGVPWLRVSQPFPHPPSGSWLHQYSAPFSLPASGWEVRCLTMTRAGKSDGSMLLLHLRGLAIAFLFLKYKSPFEEVVAAVDRQLDLLHGRHWAEGAGSSSYLLLFAPARIGRWNYHHLTDGNRGSEH